MANSRKSRDKTEDGSFMRNRIGTTGISHLILPRSMARTDPPAGEIRRGKHFVLQSTSVFLKGID
eukprot:3889101-Amphidinium_carterae.1